MSLRVGCKCNDSMFVDKMCKVCLTAAEQAIERKMESYEEILSELDGNLDEVRYYLYENPPKEEDETA